MIRKVLLATLTLATIWTFTRIDVNAGLCLNSQGDGKLYNNEMYYNYISYKDTDAKPGDVVVTFCIMNPLNNCSDDIVKRVDFILFDNVTEIF